MSSHLVTGITGAPTFINPVYLPVKFNPPALREGWPDAPIKQFLPYHLVFGAPGKAGNPRNGSRGKQVLMMDAMTNMSGVTDELAANLRFLGVSMDGAVYAPEKPPLVSIAVTGIVTFFCDRQDLEMINVGDKIGYVWEECSVATYENPGHRTVKVVPISATGAVEHFKDSVEPYPLTHEEFIANKCIIGTLLAKTADDDECLVKLEL